MTTDPKPYCYPLHNVGPTVRDLTGRALFVVMGAPESTQTAPEIAENFVKLANDAHEAELAIARIYKKLKPHFEGAKLPADTSPAPESDSPECDVCKSPGEYDLNTCRHCGQMACEDCTGHTFEDGETLCVVCAKPERAAEACAERLLAAYRAGEQAKEVDWEDVDEAHRFALEYKELKDR